MGRGDWKRSYRHDEGRRTRAQRRALRELWGTYGIRWTWDRPLDLDAAFGCNRSTILDIGFGTGDSLIATALRHPEHRVLGIEVYRPGLGAALLALEERQLNNVRIVRGDAFELLTHHVPPRTFDRVQLFFPEPWPEAPERRIVRPLLLELLSEAMKPGGLLHLVTDVEAYGEHALAVLAEAAGWARVHEIDDEGLASGTVYAGRARRQGRKIHPILARWQGLSSGPS